MVGLVQHEAAQAVLCSSSAESRSPRLPAASSCPARLLPLLFRLRAGRRMYYHTHTTMVIALSLRSTTDGSRGLRSPTPLAVFARQPKWNPSSLAFFWPWTLSQIVERHGLLLPALTAPQVSQGVFRRTAITFIQRFATCLWVLDIHFASLVQAAGRHGLRLAHALVADSDALLIDCSEEGKDPNLAWIKHTRPYIFVLVQSRTNILDALMGVWVSTRTRVKGGARCNPPRL